VRLDRGIGRIDDIGLAVPLNQHIRESQSTVQTLAPKLTELLSRFSLRLARAMFRARFPQRSASRCPHCFAPPQ
jgi:hypothetical protein